MMINKEAHLEAMQAIGLLRSTTQSNMLHSVRQTIAATADVVIHYIVTLEHNIKTYEAETKAAGGKDE